MEAKALADEISKLSAYIYAAEHRLLTLIREFDEQSGWASLGFPNCARWVTAGRREIRERSDQLLEGTGDHTYRR